MVSKCFKEIFQLFWKRHVPYLHFVSISVLPVATMFLPNILVIRISSSHINTSTSSTGKWKTIHPSKLTWNLKMNPWKRRFLLETIIFRFHVTLPGGGGCSLSFASNWASGQPAREPLRAACRIRGFLTVFRCWWHGSSDDMLSKLEAFHNLKISQCFIFLSLKRSLMVLASQAAQVVSLLWQSSRIVRRKQYTYSTYTSTHRVHTQVITHTVHMQNANINNYNQLYKQNQA